MEVDYGLLDGPVLDVYGSFDLAMKQIDKALVSRQPHALRFQGWPSGFEERLNRARRRWPTTRYAFCPGVDPVAARYCSGRASEDKCTAELIKIAEDSVKLGVGNLIYDAEAAWKTQDAAKREGLKNIAVNALREVRTRWPRMRVGLTSYGWPVQVKDARGNKIGGHTEFVWRAWLDGNLSYLGQNYYRGFGSLLAGEETSIKSFHEAIRTGIMAPETVRIPEVQLHHNMATQIVSLAMNNTSIYLWAAGSEELFDDEGSKAYSALVRLWDGGWWGKIREFQTYKDLAVDGVVGRETLNAALLL